jgi:hypothetical protein
MVTLPCAHPSWPRTWRHAPPFPRGSEQNLFISGVTEIELCLSGGEETASDVGAAMYFVVSLNGKYYAEITWFPFDPFNKENCAMHLSHLYLTLFSVTP